MTLKNRLHSILRFVSDRMAHVVLWGGLALTAVVVSLSIHEMRNLDQKNYEMFAQKFEQKIQARLEHYELALVAIRGLFMGSDFVSPDEFGDFIDELEFRDRYPDLLAISYVPRVPAKDYMAFHKAIHRYPDLQDLWIWPQHGQEEFFPVTYLRPFSTMNRTVRGFDLGSEKNRRVALERARDRNEVAFTKSVVLVQDNSRESAPVKGFVMALPVYRKDAKLRTLEDRRANLTGFLTCAFRARDVFGPLFSENFFQRTDLRFAVYDGDAPDADHLLYEANFRNPEGKEIFRPKYARAGNIDLNGSTWHYVLQAGPSFIFNPNWRAPYFMALSGLIISILLYQIIRSSRSRVEFEKKNSQSLSLAIKSRDNLMSICSHELRTPLTSMKLQSQLLNRRLSSGNESAVTFDKLRALAADWSTQLDRLNGLIEEMLDFARITSGKMKMHTEELDVSELVSRVAERMVEHAASKGSALHYDIEKNIRGYWDTFRIEQAVTNLIENAIKYGRGNPISIQLKREGKEAVITVTDSGFGIAPELHSAIFQPYERAANTEQISGLGLGLYITKRIVEAHKGKIVVTSQPDKGSTFAIRLPILTEAPKPEQMPRLELS